MFLFLLSQTSIEENITIFSYFSFLYIYTITIKAVVLKINSESEHLFKTNLFFACVGFERLYLHFLLGNALFKQSYSIYNIFTI